MLHDRILLLVQYVTDVIAGKFQLCSTHFYIDGYCI